MPFQTRDLSGADLPVAAHEWEIEALEFRPTGIELPEERHVMAVPPGENGWLVTLERFLDERGDAAKDLLRKETSE